MYSPAIPVKGAIMMAPATGIKRQFYNSLSSYLSTEGYGVITYDNRGIGGSLHGSLKRNNASLKEWGEQDATAALEALKFHFPDTKYHLVGHSAGGQLVGLMPNFNDLSSIFNVACSSGRIANMAFFFRFQARILMDLLISATNKIYGYAKTNWVGMGEPLPRQVGQDWSDWCNGQGYVKTAFGVTVNQHFYDEIEVPSMWVSATDDSIAIPENVLDMAAVFTKLRPEIIELAPADYNLKEIGHMKFFSKKSKILWKLLTDWLQAN